MHAASRLLGEASPSTRSLLGLAVAWVPTFLLFAPALDYPFVSLDDVHAVVTNPGIRSLSLDGLRHLFLEDRHEMRYFPLTYLSFAVDHHFFGLEPRGYHRTNLWLHLANTGLVFGLFTALTRDRLAATVGALAFGIHPLNVESVAWVTSRKNVLFLFFFLLSIAAYLRHVRGREEPDGRLGPWMWASVGLYAASCLSKTAGITLPALLVLIDYWRRPVGLGGLLAFLRASVPDKLAFGVALVFVQAASIHFSQPNPFATTYAFGPLEWAVIGFHNVSFYVMKALAPVELGVFYPLPEPGALPASFFVLASAGVGLVALTVYAFASGRRTLFFGLAWYGATILPLCVFAAWFSDIPILAADRYVYQSLIGLCLLLGVGLSEAIGRAGALRLPLVLAAVVGFGALLLVAAEVRSHWRSGTALYEALLENHPTDEFYYRLAAEHMASGRKEAAFQAMRDAEAAPRQIFFLDLCAHQLRLADIHRQMGNPGRAAQFVEQAIDSTPNFFEPIDARTPFAYLVLEDLWAQAGDREAARRASERGRESRVDPAHYVAANWLRLAPDASRRMLEARRTEAPEEGLAWFYLGVMASFDGDEERARELLRAASERGFPPAAPKATPGGE